MQGAASSRLQTAVTDTLSSGQEVGTSHRYMARLHHTLVTNIYQTVKYRQTQQYYISGVSIYQSQYIPNTTDRVLYSFESKVSRIRTTKILFLKHLIIAFLFGDFYLSKHKMQIVWIKGGNIKK